MPKEKSVNPAQAQRKADKAKAIKKGKAEVASRRNEKLARRNPDRLQKQLDDLKAIESSGGKLTSHEKSALESLERDVKAVRKAREALGDKAPKLGSGGGAGAGAGAGERRDGGSGNVLGKRRRVGGADVNGSSDDEGADDIPEDVKSIPMPRDTPPPIPKEVLDRWYQKRREKMGLGQGRGGRNHNNDSGATRGTNANMVPLGAHGRQLGMADDGVVSRPPVSASAPVAIEAKTTYEAKPIIRDLRKEAVTFVPAAVRAKLDKSKGIGGLAEPEEMDRLEKAGYMSAKQQGTGEMETQAQMGEDDQVGSRGLRRVMMEEVEDEDG